MDLPFLLPRGPAFDYSRGRYSFLWGEHMKRSYRYLLLSFVAIVFLLNQNCSEMSVSENASSSLPISSQAAAFNCSPRAGNGVLGAPTNTALTSGDNQSARVLSSVSNHLVMQVTDADGDSLAGVNVTWSVFQGSGQILQAVSTTNAQGCAAVLQFRLGQEIGRQMVRAEVPGLAPVYFAITGTPLDSGGIGACPRRR